MDPMDGLEPPTRWFEASRSIPLSYMGEWSGWQDLNLRLPASKAGTLAGLSYTQMGEAQTK